MRGSEGDKKRYLEPEGISYHFLPNTLIPPVLLQVKALYLQSLFLLKAYTLPCGIVVWKGRLGLFRFHKVKLPSEWLHMNCLPS